MRLKHTWLIAALAALISLPLMANEQHLERRLAEVIPNVSPDLIQPSRVDGLYEVRYGSEILYMSADGRFLFQGSIIDLDTRENLTEVAKQETRIATFNAIPDSELTVYYPEGPVLHVLNVFTDPNCPYCRQFHQDMPEYLAAGIKVRYFMFPVLGRQSPTIMRNIWCADSRTDAMDRAKTGRAIADVNCPTPLDEHLTLGQENGITGTPASITGTGQLIPGFRPAAEIIRLLEAS